VIEIDDDWRIIGFEEKPREPKPMPMEPGHALISMGNYLFTKEALIRDVSADAQSDTVHDFGNSILPSIYTSRRVFAYDFRLNEIPGRSKGEQHDYWRDVGTIQAFWEANMDLRAVNPAFNLYNRDWPLRTANYNDPPAKFVFDEEGRRGVAVNSIVSEGCIISGGWVQNSVLGRNVYIHSYSHVDFSILMDGVDIGRRSRLRRAIIEKNVKIPPDMEIGYDLAKDRARGYVVDESGIVIVPAREPDSWFDL
ncbi:MAG: glucose-1-phosphate adenylyltransferase, partial [Candidatus Tectomicrobia bacterium]|nr:glucose-1-phosphate adenylyltransferase [Candidatus Tectomicrobia bacterium]